jgi:manganese oxidase
MMAGEGQFGPFGMRGMLTIVKVREGITIYGDPGPYKNHEGTA